MADLIEHLESRLGTIQGGWTKDIAGNPMPFQVAEFRGGRLPGVVTFCTIGFSDHEIRSPLSTEVSFHQELMVSVQQQYADGPYTALLQQLAIQALDDDSAILRGDVLGPMGSIVRGSRMEAFYAALPVYYDNEFASLDSDKGHAIAIAWLVPVSAEEARFVRQQGWDVFESRLVEHDPDLLNPFRASLTL